MELVVTIPKLPALLDRLSATPEVFTEERRQAMTEATALTDDELVNVTPRRTGTLAAGWRQEISADGSQGRITNDVSYGVIVEEGSGPHLIDPRYANALVWPGANHPIRRVNHPGTRGQRIVERALERSIPLSFERIRNAVKALLAQIAA